LVETKNAEVTVASHNLNNIAVIEIRKGSNIVSKGEKGPRNSDVDVTSS
jgi:hypothetical protein